MSKEAMRLALEALEWCHGGEPCGTAEAITALREALAEQPAQQEPVACISCGAASTRYVDEDTDFPGTYCDHCGPGGVPSQQEPDYKALYEKAVEQYNELAELMAEKKEQQEPVAVVSGYYGGQCVILPIDPARIFNSNTALYTTPPSQRKPLTDEEILRLVPGLQDCLCDPYDYNNSGDDYASVPKDMIRLARAIEAAHGIKE